MGIFGKPKKSSENRPQPVGETSPPVSTRRTEISQGTVIKGDIMSNDALFNEGRIEGNLTVKNSVTVGRNGIIKADVTATSLQIHGRIIGDVVASEKVSIEHSGTVEGNIHSPKLMISEGAHFMGNIDMSHKTGDLGPGGSTAVDKGEKKKFELRGGAGTPSMVSTDS